MVFQSFGFLAFLPVAAGVCLSAARRSRPAAVRCLTAAGLVFYAAGGGWGALLVLAAGLAVSAAAVRVLTAEDVRALPGGGGPRTRGDARSAARRRLCLVLAAAWHIGVLTAFKYTGFLTGGRISPGWAPLGLSFFTFQQLWLLKEAYTGGFRPGPGDSLALYAFFFPTVVSGPILKPQAFFPQLHGEGAFRPGGRDLAAGLYAIAAGTAKKVLLADNLGTVVDSGWEHLDQLSAPAAWLVILGYTLQLYLDFSGYCDIAAGAARLLGFRLPANFDAPYRSLSINEFWKRWHITLTSFLRECLYFPLGGSRKGTGRTYLHILIVFLVSGLWHGAGWTFLIWGGLHGLGQIAERAWGAGRERVPGPLRWAMTFLFVNIAWVFFRAPDVPGALALLRAAVSAGLDPPAAWLTADVFAKEAEGLVILLPGARHWIGKALSGGLFGVSLIAALRPGTGRAEGPAPSAWGAAAMALLAAWSILSFTSVATFIYSNF
ncbi:MBOAT family protein [uncultured Oscillibacter sp.]|uniref:MBOAT family O-acyltransferase n=1 Tax=uncultured Oscillibacter sp. TaxID=876091 RepID=UPI0025F13D1F|nr:MBOAT family O-acyltransferase [uncultured Oscillibacter sp.]